MHPTQSNDFLDTYRGSLFSGQWPTVPQLLEISADRFPEGIALTRFEPSELRLTYRETLKAVQLLAADLVANGAARGDHIALSGKNSPEWAIAYLAVGYMGGVVVPIDSQLPTERIGSLLSFADARMLIADAGILEQLSASKLQARYSLDEGEDHYILGLAEQQVAQTSVAESKDLAAILFTSGTTGNEKGVMLTHDNLVSDVFLSQTHMPILSTDVFYALLPIHHSYTMTAVFLETIAVGAELVFGTRMVASRILADLKKGRVTMFLGVPLLFNKLLKSIMQGVRNKGVLVYGLIRSLMGISGFLKGLFGWNVGKKIFHTILEKASLDHIRICISGGGPLPPSTFKAYNQLGIDFVQGYGLTETAPIITLNPKDSYRVHSVGKLVPEVDARILEPDSKGRGEIAVKGPMVMQGYYKNEEATRSAFDSDGYFLTGDVGRLDRDGYLYLTGRKKTLIVTEGGKNVYPEEIEHAFQLYDEVDQVMVSGYETDDSSGGEHIQAHIHPASDWLDAQPDSSEDAVKEHMRKVVDEVNRGLQPYERIERITILDEPLEMTTTKKIKRHKA